MWFIKYGYKVPAVSYLVTRSYGKDGKPTTTTICKEGSYITIMFNSKGNVGTSINKSVMEITTNFNTDVVPYLTRNNNVHSKHLKFLSKLYQEYFVLSRE